VSSAVSTNQQQQALERCQARLGYVFKKQDLLLTALTHKSFSKQNNERLEFIGDAVLGYLVGIMLFRSNSALAEDALSLMRAKLVRGSTLAGLARELDLAPLVLLGSGEKKSGGRQRDSILADCLEALIGAVHEDGGIEACQGLVDRLFAQRVHELDPDDLKDAKTMLQEVLQAHRLELPQYTVEDIRGAAHQREFVVSCRVEHLGVCCVAEASSRRAAEQAAAQAAMRTTEVAALSVNSRLSTHE